ncbi:MAG: tRNA nucleotidyltransferase/poly(A) polymerase family protein [Solirubrobacteraceae bacterium]
MVAERSARSGAILIDRLASLAGGKELLELAAGRRDVELVGGAVRDLLLEREPRELDVVVGGAALELATALARRLGGEARAHERFGTALVLAPGVRIDVATRRAESYARAGALPEVRRGSGEEDLLRRDFTVNAIALPLDGAARGELRAAPSAFEDVELRRLRVLHDQSFLDDPTRILRLHRYAARLSFEIEGETAALAAAALAGGALATVSPARIGAELRLALAERDVLATLAQLNAGGVLAKLAPPALRLRADEAATGVRADEAAPALRFRADILTAALSLLPGDGEPGLLALASMLLGCERAAIRPLLDAWALPAAERDVVEHAATRAEELERVLAETGRPSQIVAALAGAPIESVALAGGLAVAGRQAARCEAARRAGRQAARVGQEAGGPGQVHARAGGFLERLRHVRLQIGGEDLIAAGVEPGPAIGRALRRALALRLDGELGPARADELAAALEEARR